MSAERTDPRVFTIPAGAPFLPILADALLARVLAPFGDDPLDLAAVTVLLPTRRAVRAFRDLLIDRLGREAAILPIIRTIGDVDEEEALLDPASEAPEDQLVLPQSVSPLARRLILTRLVLDWGQSVRHAALRLKEGELPLVAGSAADAARLAGDLGRLIDDMEIAKVPWSRLQDIAPEDHAAYYGLTLDFLRVVTEQWPNVLASQGLVDPARRRNTLIEGATKRLDGRAGPVIAAGSTGSIPTTADLLKKIARLPNGAVVLPGLDQSLDEVGWKFVGGDEAVRQTHPQYGLKQLIEHIGINRADVGVLGEARAPSNDRARLVSEAMRPADTLEFWMNFRAAKDAMHGAAFIVARNEREEALAIALALREAIEKGQSAALVTPDRTLARRVAAELGRWNLAVDDSAGRPLEKEAHGVFARLLVEAAAVGNPLNLLALLKHPLAAFGMSRHDCQMAARALELLLFRGHRLAGTITDLPQELAKSLEYLASEEGKKRAHPARKNPDARKIALATTLAERLANILGPLQGTLQRDGVIPVAEVTEAVVVALAAAVDTHDVDATEIWAGPGGKSLATLFETLRADALLTVRPSEYPHFLSAVMAEASVVDPRGPETRIHIWGALEARLQSVDVLVLGALDEGVWPAATRTDPWLSRAMRTEMGLPPPERRVGLAAHDFAQGMANDRVIVTRAEKRGGAPTVESRWLQRLAALVGKDAVDGLRAEGAKYLRIARALDRPSGQREFVARPAPKPPVALRPRSLSITEIETLIRDPYAIYAKHILKLRRLDDLGLTPDRALRGTLIHDALGKFTEKWTGGMNDDAERQLLQIGEEVLQAVAGFPDVHAVWRHRFGQVTRWFLEWERARDATVSRRLAEIDGAWTFEAPGGNFTLRGRADRIDEMTDATIAIYDFKTGAPQTQKTLYAGLTPQLDLEAAMVRAGAFSAVTSEAGRSVSDLAWLAIGQVGRADPYKSAVKKGETADGDADKAAAMFRDLIFAFDVLEQAYTSRTRPMLERWPSDYDHLARVREWALVESGDDLSVAGLA